MPIAGTYKKTAKKKHVWYVRKTDDGFQVFDETTGIPLCGYWGKHEIATKNGTQFFQCPPAHEYDAWAQGAPAQAAQDGNVQPGGEHTNLDVPPPVHGVQPDPDALGVRGGEAPVAEGGDGSSAKTEPPAIPDAGISGVELLRAKFAPGQK